MNDKSSLSLEIQGEIAYYSCFLASNQLRLDPRICGRVKMQHLLYYLSVDRRIQENSYFKSWSCSILVGTTRLLQDE
jgi:hypothetical protein